MREPRSHRGGLIPPDGRRVSNVILNPLVSGEPEGASSPKTVVFSMPHLPDPLVGDKLHDPQRMTGSMRFAGDTQGKRMRIRREFRAQHYRAGIMDPFAVGMQ